MSDSSSPSSPLPLDGIPLDRPSVARLYDYMLGGYHNFEIDRQVAARFTAVYPDFPLTAQVNRAFLRRALEYVASQGIDQYLDLGSGIPTSGNVHEIVTRRKPDAHVVYVDIDPIAIAHSEAILEGNSHVTAILGDLSDAEAILSHPKVTGLIDFSRPMCLIILAAIHFVPDSERAARAVETYKRALAPGSYLIMGVWTFDDVPAYALAQYAQLTQAVSTPGHPRSKVEIESYFSGLELVEPGLVHSPSWRPDAPDGLMTDDPGRCLTWVGVARKPQ